jgi:hypothetical protein
MRAIAIAIAVSGLALLSLGASRVPYGGTAGLLLSLVGCVAAIVAAFSLGNLEGGTVRRVSRSALVVIGVLILWVGLVSAATAVAGHFYARSHHTPYTASAEIILAGICAAAAPLLLTFKAKTWMGWSRRTFVLTWIYWLAFYPITIIAAALGQPWG